MIDVTIIYMTGSKNMLNDHSHIVRLPAVPREQEQIQLTTIENKPRLFFVATVRWRPYELQYKVEIEVAPLDGRD